MPAHAIPEMRKGNIPLKGQIHQFKIRLCRIRCLKSLMPHILRVREESHFLFGGQDHKPLFPFRFTVAGTSIQQEVRVSMPLELPGYPQTVNVHVALRPACLSASSFGTWPEYPCYWRSHSRYVLYPYFRVSILQVPYPIVSLSFNLHLCK